MQHISRRTTTDTSQLKQWQKSTQTQKENHADPKEQNERKWQPRNDPKTTRPYKPKINDVKAWQTQ